MTKYSPSIWRLLHTGKSTVKILSIFVAFSENVNFIFKWPKISTKWGNSPKIPISETHTPTAGTVKFVLNLVLSTLFLYIQLISTYVHKHWTSDNYNKMLLEKVSLFKDNNYYVNPTSKISLAHYGRGTKMRKEVTYPALNVPCDRLLTYFHIKLIKLYFSYFTTCKVSSTSALNKLYRVFFATKWYWLV